MTPEIAAQNLDGLEEDRKASHQHMTNLQRFRHFKDADLAAALLDGISANLKSNQSYIQQLRGLIK